MLDKTTERTFQNDIIHQMQANGWQLGKSKHYNRELALKSLPKPLISLPK